MTPFESHAVLSMAELVEEEGSPTLLGVLMTQSHLHILDEEVEYLTVVIYGKCFVNFKPY